MRGRDRQRERGENSNVELQCHCSIYKQWFWSRETKKWRRSTFRRLDLSVSWLPPARSSPVARRSGPIGGPHAGQSVLLVYSAEASPPPLVVKNRNSEEVKEYCTLWLAVALSPRVQEVSEGTLPVIAPNESAIEVILIGCSYINRWSRLSLVLFTLKMHWFLALAGWPPLLEPPLGLTFTIVVCALRFGLDAPEDSSVGLHWKSSFELRGFEPPVLSLLSEGGRWSAAPLRSEVVTITTVT